MSLTQSTGSLSLSDDEMAELMDRQGELQLKIDAVDVGPGTQD